jgi:hypothetical protein
MKLGNKIYVTLILFFCFLPLSYAEEKITTSPLINVENIKPSFEELDEEENISSRQNLIKKKNNKIDSVAYMQVKDLSKNENEQVFIFNGWTFASDPNLTPFDHAIYNLQLLNCSKA